jgi:hypothetical protein
VRKPAHLRPASSCPPSHACLCAVPHGGAHVRAHGAPDRPPDRRPHRCAHLGTLPLTLLIRFTMIILKPPIFLLQEPTAAPTFEPTAEPTASPTEEPTASPTEEPTPSPTESPTEVRRHQATRPGLAESDHS